MSSFDPVAWLASVLDPEAYDDAAWRTNADLYERGVDLLAQIRAERQSKAERKAMDAYAALRRNGRDITGRDVSSP